MSNASAMRVPEDMRFVSLTHAFLAAGRGPARRKSGERAGQNADRPHRRSRAQRRASACELDHKALYPRTLSAPARLGIAFALSPSRDGWQEAKPTDEGGDVVLRTSARCCEPLTSTQN